jgi:predicted ATP-dependent serine protease
VEVQALVAPTTLAAPRRTVAGLDGQRLALLWPSEAGAPGSGCPVMTSTPALLAVLSVEEPAIDLPWPLPLPRRCATS